MPRISAMRNAAGPSTGGEMTAPIPPADRIAPLDSRSWPAFFSIGYAIEPRVTVVATPDPETVPRRNEATVTVRAAPVGRLPVRAKARATENLPAPVYSRIAP